MIDLSSEPSLGSLILTSDAILKYTYVLPRGMTFPDDAEAYIVFSDRAGGVYNVGDYKWGSLNDSLSQFTWVIGSELTEQIPAGSNFEVFITLDGSPYKVRYGRVVRKEVSYPLNPLTTESAPLLYTDDMQRNMPGPLWLPIYGTTSMRQGSSVSGNPYIMGARNQADVFGFGLSLWSSAAVRWYAPLQSDTIEIGFKATQMASDNDGNMTVVFSSDSTFTKFLGVRITDPGGTGTDTIQVVRGSAWNSVTGIGSTISYNTPASGGDYKIKFSGSASPPTVQVYTPASSTTPALTTDLSSFSAYYSTGAGYRYTGLIFNGSLVTQGPMIYYWKAKDAV